MGGWTLYLSDIDFSNFNPLENPPPVQDFQRYTLLNSTDATIQQAGLWLVQTYLSWEYFPDLTTTVLLVGEEYWLANSVIVSEVSCEFEHLSSLSGHPVIGHMLRLNDTNGFIIRLGFFAELRIGFEATGDFLLLLLPYLCFFEIPKFGWLT